MRLHDNLTRRVVLCDLLAFWIHKLTLEACAEGTGRAERDVVFGGGADDSTGLSQTVTLTHNPAWILLLDILGCLLTERCGAGEDVLHGAEVELSEHLWVVDHGDDDRWDEVEGVELELRDGGQVGCHLELWEDDDLVAAVGGGEGDDDEAVDVREWEKTEADVHVWKPVLALAFARVLLVKADLEDVVDAVAVGDHDALRKTGCAGGVAKKCGLLCALALRPLRLLNWCKLLALLDELSDGLEWDIDLAGERLGHLKDVDALIWDTACLCCDKSGLKEWNAGLRGCQLEFGERDRLNVQ